MHTFFVTIFSLCRLVAGFYDISYTDWSGQQQSMNQFAGKKVLIVNIATSGARANQIGGLQQLQERYGDSLVIIAFPSNSFGNEPLTDSAIRAHCVQQYGMTFRLATTASVSGTNAQSLFQWLADSTQNGGYGNPPLHDFQKYLINQDGDLVGVFSPSVTPTDPKLITAINAL